MPPIGFGDASDDSDDEPMPPPSNAFEVMMARKKQRVETVANASGSYLAIVYRHTLARTDDPDDPLKGVPYIGEACRSGYATPEMLMKDRWKAHQSDAKCDPREIGFRAAIQVYGPDAFDSEVLTFERFQGYKEGKNWSHALEKDEIAKHGGILRNMDPAQWIKQTFNLNKGGAGGPTLEAIEAWSNKAWTKFHSEMLEFAEEHGTAYVSRDYYNPKTGYKLGVQVSHVRQGVMLRDRSDESERRAWLNSLPRWTWNAIESDEYKEKRSKMAKDRWQDPEIRAKNINGLKEAKATVTRARLEKAREEVLQWVPESKRIKGQFYVRNDGLIGREDGNGRLTIVGKMTDDAVEMSAEEKKNREAAAHKAAHNTAKFKEVLSKRTIAQHAREKREQLEYARTVYVPYVKSSNRRIEMRNASTLPLNKKKGGKQLFMLSEDGKTIRSVSSQGVIGERQIVGPLVDPIEDDEKVESTTTTNASDVPGCSNDYETHSEAAPEED